MKKYVRKILAGVIALVMILGNFTGMGVSEVRAADKYTLSIKVLEGSNPVKNLQLVLKNGDEDLDIELCDTTYEDGTVETTDVDNFELLDMFDSSGEEELTYTIQPAESEGYTCSSVVEVVFGKEENGYSGDRPYVKTVNNAVYGGQTVELKVTSSGGDIPSKKEITEVTSSVSEIAYAGGKAAITVKGTELPSSFSCNIYYAYKGNDTGRIISSGTVKAEGTNQEAKINLNLPDVSECTDVSGLPSEECAWRIGISIPGTDLWKYVRVAILDDNVTSEIRAALNTAIAGMTRLKEKDYTAASWKAYSDAVEAGKALLKKEDATGTEYRKATETIERTKAALVIAKVNVSNITISGLSKSIVAGKKIQLAANVSPANATNKTVKWTTSNKKYATVDSNGKVSIKKAGAGKTVTITAAATDGSGKKAAYKIKIMKNAVKSIKLKAAKSVKAGKSLKVKATVKTTGKKANKTLKWTSSNTKYATVSSKGVVKTKKAGKGKKVKITAMSTDGSNKKKTVTVTIK